MARPRNPIPIRMTEWLPSSKSNKKFFDKELARLKRKGLRAWLSEREPGIDLWALYREG